MIGKLNMLSYLDEVAYLGHKNYTKLSQIPLLLSGYQS